MSTKVAAPDGDQHMGAQTAAALAVLALGTDQGAEHKGREQADQRIEEIAESEGVKKRHDGRLSNSCAADKWSEMASGSTAAGNTGGVLLAAMSE